MTLDCVGITQSSVIQVIHRNVDLKCFFHLPKFLLSSLVFAYNNTVLTASLCINGFLPNFCHWLIAGWYIS